MLVQFLICNDVNKKRFMYLFIGQNKLKLFSTTSKALIGKIAIFFY